MSKNIDLLSISNDLVAFGIDEKAGQVYIDLLRGGNATAITVSKRLDLHRQFVYNALATLEEKGLVVRVTGKRPLWEAQHPRTLLTLAEAHEEKARTLSALLAPLRKTTAAQEFDVAEGQAAFRGAMLDHIRATPAQSVVRMICGEWQQYFSRVGESVHEEWERIRNQKHIAFKLVGPQTLYPQLKDAAQRRKDTTYRVLPGLENNLVNTVIYDDTVAFYIYGEPHLTFSIKNSAVAKSQAHYFDTLWRLASG